jgi:glycosyltransferase involved in cell wall biosynthesis
MASISVVIATYGGYEWSIMGTERALPSADNQDADDVTMVYRREGTRATSLNDGADEAKGDWLIFLDADDELAPGYVGAMRRALEQHPDGKVLFTPAVQHIRKGRPAPPAFMKEVDMRGGNWLVIGTMVSRALFNEVGGFHEHPHGLEDWNFFARCVRAGANIVRVKDAVYRAFVNPQSEHHKLQRRRGEYMEAYERARVDAWG